MFLKNVHNVIHMGENRKASLVKTAKSPWGHAETGAGS